MKVFRIAAIAAFMLIASQASASLIKTSFFGGYTTLGMGDVNDAIKKASTAPTVTGEEITSGIFLGADLLMTAGPLLKWGPRVEYIFANKGGVKSPTTTTDYEYTLLPLMGGITVGTGFPGTGFEFEVGAFGGYGLANAKLSSSNPAVPSTSGSEGGFVAEGSVKLGYSIAPLFTFDIMAGYRNAKISAGASEVDFSGIIAGGGFGISF